MKAGWEKKTLGDVATLQRGFDLPTQDRLSGEYQIVSSSGVIDTHHKCAVKGPGVVTGRSGSIGNVFFVEEDFWPLNTVLYVKDFHGNDPRFIFHLLNQFDLKRFATGTGVPTLNRNFVHDELVNVPPLPEQRRIVGILDEAFDGIATAKANAEKNLQNARALFESHLQAVFSERGEGWVEKRLGDICERVSVGHVGPTSQFYCDQSEGIPFLRSQNVRRGFLDWGGVQYVTKEFHQKLKKSQLRAGDLLFVRVGANRGDCCSLPNDAGEINCANIVFARPTKGNADYLERYCDSTHGREQLLGMTTGSAQGVINTHSVADLIVPIPPPQEQKRIVDSLNEFQDETQRLESICQQKLAALDALKKLLLDQAFTVQL